MKIDSTVQLLHGLELDGVRHCEALVRDLTGHEEALLDAPHMPAVVVSSLISSAVRRIGDIAPITPALAARLTVGDRERLILAMSIMTFGDQVDLVAHCPNVACGEAADVNVRLSDFLGLDHRIPESHKHLELKGTTGEWSIRVRPLTGSDQETIYGDANTTARKLVLVGVEQIKNPDGKIVQADDLPPEFESELSIALSSFDAAAESVSVMQCPSCDSTMEVLLDGFTVLRSSLTGSLSREVYRMARSYHWSESEILELPIQRRKHYLAIAETIESGA